MISVAELAAGAADMDLLGVGGQPVRPLLIVDLDRSATAGEVREAVRRARDSRRLLVGVRGARASGDAGVRALVDALDVTLVPGAGTRATVTVEDTSAEAEFVRDCVERQPQAALVLRQLLRIQERLPVRQALEAESLAYSTLLGGAGFGAWLKSRERMPAATAPQLPVGIRRDGDILHLTLNHPERRNAHSAQLRDALTEALQIAVHDPTIREVVLDGAGPDFSSGGDLAEFGTATDRAAAHLIRVHGGAAPQLHVLYDRLTARIHGHCVGAGIELPAFAARVHAAPDTCVRLPELEMGLIPGAGGTVSIPRRVGRHRALYLMLTGRTLTAERALEWGLVDRVG